MSHFTIARLVAAASLLLATLSLPYWYYTLMRWLVCMVAGYGAVRANERKMPGWVWPFGGLAVGSNPIRAAWGQPRGLDGRRRGGAPA
jgi:hypothetical protein